MTIAFKVNGKPVRSVSPADTPLLWVLRDELQLTGTQFGCAMAECGACTAHVDGQAVRSCVTPVGGLAGKSVVPIEGLTRGPDRAVAERVQQAWLSEGVSQCGYCQPGHRPWAWP